MTDNEQINNQNETSQRELKKQYQDDKRNRAQKRNAAKWVFYILLITVAIAGAWFVMSNSPKVDLADAVSLNENDWIIGDSNAPITLIEYSDFQCPACAYYDSFIKQLLNDFPDDLAFAYRHFPLSSIHMNALGSASAAEAAGLQNKFWEMHDLLFENQTDWSESTSASDMFKKYAEQLGLDTAKFQQDYESDIVLNKIKHDSDEALSLRLQGTPSLFLDGKLITLPNNYEGLKRLVENAKNTN